MKAAICRESSCIVLGHGKCDICLNEGPVAYIRELDRSYCKECLETIVWLIQICEGGEFTYGERENR
jgi:hypothetical protein